MFKFNFKKLGFLLIIPTLTVILGTIISAFFLISGTLGGYAPVGFAPGVILFSLIMLSAVSIYAVIRFFTNPFEQNKPCGYALFVTGSILFFYELPKAVNSIILSWAGIALGGWGLPLFLTMLSLDLLLMGLGSLNEK